MGLDQFPDDCKANAESGSIERCSTHLLREGLEDATKGFFLDADPMIPHAQGDTGFQDVDVQVDGIADGGVFGRIFEEVSKNLQQSKRIRVEFISRCAAADQQPLPSPAERSSAGLDSPINDLVQANLLAYKAELARVGTRQIQEVVNHPAHHCNLSLDDQARAMRIYRPFATEDRGSIAHRPERASQLMRHDGKHVDGSITRALGGLLRCLGLSDRLSHSSVRLSEFDAQGQ